MTTTRKPDREAIRTLAIAIGLRPAARQLGLNEDTVCAWSAREGWFTQKPQPPPQAIQPQALQAKPGDALQSLLATHERKTKLGLAIAHSRHAKAAARGDYAPKETLQIAQGAAITHGWKAEKDKDQAQVAVNIAILNA